MCSMFSVVVIVVVGPAELNVAHSLFTLQLVKENAQIHTLLSIIFDLYAMGVTERGGTVGGKKAEDTKSCPDLATMVQ